MKIKEFIRDEVLLPRLRERGVLVLYDPDRRYRELCLELAAPERRVVDAGVSSLESREQALATLQELGQPGTKVEGMLVYVPAKAPLTEEQKQRDPFAIYGVCGAVFPEGDGDEYLSLCLKARADHAPEIRRVFQENPNPPFAVIDAVGGGGGWPTLQALLSGPESARDILFALLAPSAAQQTALKGQEAWVAEARDLFQRCLGMKLQTRGKTWSSLADELWRFVLFSEFAFDLPVPLPGALDGVPRALADARPVIEDVGERLRNDRRTQAAYLDRADSVEKELNLPAVCAGITDLGTRDTFPFEERAVLARAIAALERDDADTVRQILARHAGSVWVGKGENQAEWLLLQAAASLVEACGDAETELPAHAASQGALLDFYIGRLREIDRLQREFEQAAGDLLPAVGMEKVLALARAAYRGLMGRAQDLFVKHLEKAGWPPAGRLANAAVFDHLVAPHLQESGRRVAYLLIDALRYELGVELEKQLAESGKVEVQAAFAQLPSVTPVGMASLLPGAATNLRLTRKDNEVVPVLGDQPLTSVTQRLDVLRKRYGQRFEEATLTDFVRARAELPTTVDLLVIRSNAMDRQLESNAEETLGLIYETLKRIRAAIHRLAALGFQEVVIATDHGFFLNMGAGAGDDCPKPPGNWLTLHERCLLGDGRADASSFVLPAGHLGIRGDFAQVGGPRALAAYRAGVSYFHGGASLQETVVPVLTVRLRAAEAKAPQRPGVTLRYKRGAKRITTRVPVIELAVEVNDLFAEGAVEILLEAHEKKNNVVGEAKPGGPVNPATRAIFLKPGETVQVPLRMAAEFEGKFTVKALDPGTLAAYSKLDLETDYTVCFMDALDRKLLEHFEGKVVRKDLLHRVKKGTNVPTFVLEFLLSRYCASDDPAEIQEGLEAVLADLGENYVKPDEANAAQSKVATKGKHRFIDKVHVRYVEREKQHWATLENFNSQRVAIAEKFYRDTDRLLEGGIWAEVTVAYNEATDDDFAFYVEDLRPIQLSRFNFEAYARGRGKFTRDEWLDVILRSVGLEPAKLAQRVKFHFVARLAPLVEPNFNLIELGPRGTGKSYFFSEFSPYATLLSGGQATKATLFYNNARRRIGLIGFWDTVAFDEVAGITIRDPDTIQIMKDYMANGRFSRGVEVVADASLAFVGNMDHSVEQLVHSAQHDLFLPLPKEFDLAVMDRFACYLPGWEMPKTGSEYLTSNYGFITDYLAEAFHHQASHTNRYEEVTQRIRLGSDVEGRDEKAIKKTVCAFLKVLHPDGPPADAEFEEYVTYAVECRRRIKEQMNKRKPDDEFAKIALSYFTAGGKEVVVACPESREADATQHPVRKQLAPRGKKASAVVGEASALVAAAPVSAEKTAEPKAPVEPELKEQHFTIQYGDVGHTYESLFGLYLRGAKEILIEDPYIRLPHQVGNLVRVCETAVKHGTVKKIRLITTYEHSAQQGEVTKKLEELKQSLLEVDVEFHYEWDQTLHDREIRIDNGWVVKIGRGLDIYQPPQGYFAIGATDMALRPCLQTKVDVFRTH